MVFSLFCAENYIYGQQNQPEIDITRVSVFDWNMRQIVYRLELRPETPLGELTAILQTS